MDFLHTENRQILCGEEPALLRGVGLGGWLLPEGYMWKFYTKCDRPRRIEKFIEDSCGKKYAKQFWKRYYDIYTTEKDIAWIAEKGFNSVRLPFNWRHLFLHNENEITGINEEIAFYIDRCIQWCRKYGLYVFLDMHAAPGGQTGQNIDDSEDDTPKLFLEERYQEMLIDAWSILAERYCNEETVGGYDLLNEPLPKWNSHLNDRLLPLYRKLINAIRSYDDKHIIILEGAHWDTDFSVFEGFKPDEAKDNIVLEFHKYWSNPDVESIEQFIEISQRLNVPLWMGEGGENNKEWYSYVFSMYENNNIGWNFWTFKKMDGYNSPSLFRFPEKWQNIIDALDGKPIATNEAQKAFDDFLNSVSNTEYNGDVVNAIMRIPPVVIPAAAYDFEAIVSDRKHSVDFRRKSKANIVFMDGHSGTPDWNRYGGEEQPESQKLCVNLKEGDSLSYKVNVSSDTKLTVSCEKDGDGTISVQNSRVTGNEVCCYAQDGAITIKCSSNDISLLSLTISKAV